MEKVKISNIDENGNSHSGKLISILDEIQSKYGYLPKDDLERVAADTGISMVDIYGVATFYRAFSLTPRGKHLISSCLGTACHVRGGPAIAKEIENCLGIKAGETTHDNEFTFETVNCLGACALGPVVVVDGHYFPNVKTSEVREIINNSQKGFDIVEVETDKRIFPLEVSCARCNHSLMDSNHILDGHPAIRITVSFGNKHGWFVLSSLYGSTKIKSQHEIPLDTIVLSFCPHCHAELVGGGACVECEAPMVPMIVRGGGVVQICSRRGCKGHILDLGGSSLS